VPPRAAEGRKGLRGTGEKDFARKTFYVVALSLHDDLQANGPSFPKLLIISEKTRPRAATMPPLAVTRQEAAWLLRWLPDAGIPAVHFLVLESSGKEGGSTAGGVIFVERRPANRVRKVCSVDLTTSSRRAASSSPTSARKV